jgi:hypothetical protein
MTFTVIVYGVVSHKSSHTLQPLLIYCDSPSELQSVLRAYDITFLSVC